MQLATPQNCRLLKQYISENQNQHRALRRSKYHDICRCDSDIYIMFSYQQLNYLRRVTDSPDLHLSECCCKYVLLNNLEISHRILFFFSDQMMVVQQTKHAVS